MRETALHWAVKRNLLDLAKLLIRKGAYTNAKDSLGRTPLYVAANHNNVSMTQMLLFEKVVINIRSNSGKRAIDVTTNT
jgi:ankyrin repeat protein